MEPFLRLRDISRLTGISIPTLRRWIAAGNCPPYRQTPTGVLLFKRVEVEHWFDQLPGVGEGEQGGPAFNKESATSRP
ncbi:MAG: helix-turn-helix transcriptional regulator [Desulfomonilaceae bacterium]